MIRPLVLGSLLGLFSGVVPGPYSALVASAALRGGFWTGFRLAVLPVLTESVVLVAVALSLTQLPERVLRIMGLAGGVVVFFLAYRTWKRSREPRPNGDGHEGQSDEAEEQGDLAAAVALAVLSPSPWVFWLLVGAPLFLASWHQGWAPGLAFFLSFVVCLSGVHVALAALAGYGHRRLPEAWHRRLLLTAAAALVLVGSGLLWQSWVGNFQRMVKGSEEIRALVPDSIR